MADLDLEWSLWSKDIIFLITSDSKAGPQAWVDAYHDAHSPPSVTSLPLKSGALQGVVVVDNALNHRFESLHITYDGINGQLPNLDLFNTAVAIASGQMGIGVSLQRMWKHDDTYKERLRTILRGMVSQGLGHASGPHSSFIPYHIDAITLQAVGEGWQDEMAMGRCIESTFRSLNNLLEHFHQSFFFYLLMQANRFVSIGTYLPSAMLVAVNFTIMAIALWVQSGRPPKPKAAPSDSEKTEAEIQVVRHDGMVAFVPKETFAIVERQLFLPMAFVFSLHFLGVIPLYIFNNSSQAVSSPRPASKTTQTSHLTSPQALPTIMLLFAISNLLLPTVLASTLSHFTPPTAQQTLLIKSFSLLLLGMFLSTLATLNFSLAFLIGILSAPLSFLGPLPSPSSAQDASAKQNMAYWLPSSALLHVLSPPAVLFGCCWFWGVGVGEVLIEAAFGWKVWGMWTQVVVWCVWWPAWLVGAVFVSPSSRV